GIDPITKTRYSRHGPSVLRQASRQLLGGLDRRELGKIDLLLGKELARLQLEQRGDEHEELAHGIEVEPLLLGQPFAERDDDRGHVDLRRTQLVLQDERQQQIEGALERVEIELELPELHEAGG